MKSQKIVDYYNFLESKDEGNSKVFDDGSEALFCLLFKLLGDERSMYDITCIFDFPTATELKGGAEEGDYSYILNQAEEHGCELEENGVTQGITAEIIQKLENFLPALTDRIQSQELARNSDFLNSIL